MSGVWLERLRPLLEANTGDLRELALIAGENPHSFYMGADLSKTDLRGQDLTGMDFTGAKLAGSIYDEKTVVDEKYGTDLYDKMRLRNIYVSPAVERLVMNYADSLGYVYVGWAYKNLINLGALEIATEGDQYWLEIIVRLADADDFFKNSRARKLIRVRLGDRTTKLMRDRRQLFDNPLEYYDYIIIVGLLGHRGVNRHSVSRPLTLAGMFPWPHPTALLDESEP